DTPDSLYTINDYAVCVHHLLDALNIHTAHIMGTHAGAAIGIEVAISWPERVEKLILNGCPFLSPEVRRTRLADPAYAPMEIKEDASHLIKIWKTARKWSPNADPLNWHRWLVDYLISGKQDAHQALFRYEIEKRLPLIKSPSLLISGTEDIFYDKMDVTRRLIPECKTKVIEGGGFILGYENAIEFSRAILEFLCP
ncbi:MAG: alpha/beta hydrolase, partial [Desulfobacteraceae bacterium]|nr:alpha/beta hydrolase [Desulfobacteraceae bacterium]